MQKSEVVEKATIAKKSSSKLVTLSEEQKNAALLQMADKLIERKDVIMEANKRDLQRGEESGLSKALLDRLALNDERIEAMAEGLKQIVDLKDPIGEQLDTTVRPNGMRIDKVRVPIGLIGIIFEARPNVTVDAAGLCLKTGNAVLLRGGSSAVESNKQIVAVLHEALEQSAIPSEALQLIFSTDRSSVNEMLKLNGLLDVIIPRGGASLIQNVVQNSSVPVIETGAGVCHTYIDAEAKPDQAIAIALNAKIQRPSVCNAMETLIVHENFAEEHLHSLAEQMKASNVQMKGCEQAKRYISSLEQATEQDFATEYNDYMLNVKVVSSFDEALDHIQTFGTGHSECIVTENAANADRFLQEVDAAAVYHNVSTRFTDGFEFGFGAEIGISTQKLHARGPMGLEALTSMKYRITGNGQIRS